MAVWCRFQIDWLGAKPDLKRSQAVFAIHSREAGTELAILQCLKQAPRIQQVPILYSLLRLSWLSEKHVGLATEREEPKVQAERVADQFRLNTEQKQALTSILPWYIGTTEEVSLHCLMY